MHEFPDVLGGLEAEYEIVRKLGQGGSSTAYLARDRELEREVTIKVIDDRHLGDEEAQTRFRRQARMLAQIRHPNIVQIYVAKRLDAGRLALVMQHLGGPTLRELLQQTGPLPVERARALLRDLADALAFLHGRGIIHRDVKPENIYLDPQSGRALLSDFGIAKPLDDQGGVTMTGAVIGTPAYMSPEQVDGHRLDGRSDLYSLGLVGHEMLSGQQPWAGEGIYAIIYKQKNDYLPPLAELRADAPAPLRDAIERALRKERDERWESADAFLEALSDEAAPAEAIGAPARPVAREEPVELVSQDYWRRAMLDAEVEVEELPPPPSRRYRRAISVGAASVAVFAGVAVVAAAMARRPAIDTPAAGSWVDATSEFQPAGAAALLATNGEAAAALPSGGLDPALQPAATGTAAPAAEESTSALLIRGLYDRIQDLENKLGTRTEPAPARSAAAAAPPSTPAESTLAGVPATAVNIAVPTLDSRPLGEPRVTTTVPALGAATTATPASASAITAPVLRNPDAVLRFARDAYPRALWSTRTGGTSWLTLVVEASGSVSEATVQTSSGNALLDQAALRVGRRLSFTPALHEGRPVRHTVRFPVQFAPNR